MTENQRYILIYYLMLIYFLLFFSCVSAIESIGGLVYSLLWLTGCFLVLFRRISKSRFGFLVFLDFFGSTVILSAIFIWIGYYFSVYEFIIL